uniref:Organic cation transporter protein-like n=1 Tax=Saccoglossus kowalevskii TaxID=10224 RepID=A0ABM0MSH4_SACKO|nr:PREDICTED: organic cation transporter protein-like [Saccoglossus kowalevskii]
MVQYDDLLRDFVGEFGTFQKICFVLLGIASIPWGCLQMSPVFMLATTDTWCKIPYDNEIASQFCVVNYTSNCEELIKNLTIPREKIDIGCGATWRFEQCHRYDIGNVSVVSYANEPNIPTSLNNTAKITCDHGWEYDRSQYKSTVSQEFNLVCDKFYLNAMVSTIFMFGLFVGSFVVGNIFDRLGRRKGFIVTLIVTIILGTIEAFAPNYIVFVVVRFFMAASGYGLYLAGFILACEYVGPSKRTLTGMVYPIFFAVGFMQLSLHAYFIRHWWILQLSIMAPCILFLSYWWIIPESPRWLISKGRTDEAEAIIRKCCRINKVELPEEEFREALKNIEKSMKVGSY